MRHAVFDFEHVVVQKHAQSNRVSPAPGAEEKMCSQLPYPV